MSQFQEIGYYVVIWEGEKQVFYCPNQELPKLAGPYATREKAEEAYEELSK